MVSFSCEQCNDVIPKKKLDQHRNQCRRAIFTCLDCSTTFRGTEYRSHTSCISEAQKYQGHLYREKDKKNRGEKRKSMNDHDDSQAMVPRKAYVEDAIEGDDSQVVAVIDVPPRAPTPPSAVELPDNVNVFDFLVSEETPNGSRTAIHAPDESHMFKQPHHYGNGDSQYSQYSHNGPQYMQHGFTYGNAPVNPTFARYDSWQDLNNSQQPQALMPPPQYVTPAPKEHRKEKKEKHASEKSDKKRKRQQVEELDLSSVKRPSSRDASMLDAPVAGSGGRVLHSGLTGGLNKLVTDPEFYEDRIDAGPTPILSPIKRNRRDEDVKKDRRKSSYAAYSTTTTSTKPSSKADRHHRSRSVERVHHDERRRPPSNVPSTHYDDKHRLRRHRESVSTTSDDRPNRKHFKPIEYYDRIERPASVQPGAHNQIVSYKSRADLFMSFINKGPDSEHGCSINKVLKRYHRERDVRGEAKDEEDKELWKSLRLRRNDRGEIVLFI